MVAHIDPGDEQGHARVVPARPLGRHPGHGRTKINAAFNDGPATGRSRRSSRTSTSRSTTISRSTSPGSANIVDAIGSVPIYFPTPARDTNTGCAILLPGCQTSTAARRSRTCGHGYYEYRTGERRLARGPVRPTSAVSSASSTSSVRWRKRRSSGGPEASLKANNILEQGGRELHQATAASALSDSTRSRRRFAKPIPAVVQMVTVAGNRLQATGRRSSSTRTRRRRCCGRCVPSAPRRRNRRARCRPAWRRAT